MTIGTREVWRGMRGDDEWGVLWIENENLHRPSSRLLEEVTGAAVRTGVGVDSKIV